jgi:hypothetical protein
VEVDTKQKGWHTLVQFLVIFLKSICEFRASTLKLIIRTYIQIRVGAKDLEDISASLDPLANPN